MSHTVWPAMVVRLGSAIWKMVSTPAQVLHMGPGTGYAFHHTLLDSPGE